LEILFSGKEVPTPTDVFHLLRCAALVLRGRAKRVPDDDLTQSVAAIVFEVYAAYTRAFRDEDTRLAVLRALKKPHAWAKSRPRSEIFEVHTQAQAIELMVIDFVLPYLRQLASARIDQAARALAFENMARSLTLCIRLEFPYLPKAHDADLSRAVEKKLRMLLKNRDSLEPRPSTAVPFVEKALITAGMDAKVAHQATTEWRKRKRQEVAGPPPPKSDRFIDASGASGAESQYVEMVVARRGEPDKRKTR